MIVHYLICYDVIILEATKQYNKFIDQKSVIKNK